MPRPARYDVDSFLDAAAASVLGSGAGGVTMSAVAETVGAPSGSVYHRFADRVSLMAALWLRTLDRFESGLLAAMTAEPADVAVAAAARFVIDWARESPAEASVLLSGPHAFDSSRWPAQDRSALDRADDELRRAIHRLARRARTDPERLTLVIVDLPYALVRRHLSRGTPIPASAGEMVEEAARSILSIPL